MAGVVLQAQIKILNTNRNTGEKKKEPNIKLIKQQCE